MGFPFPFHRLLPPRQHCSSTCYPFILTSPDVLGSSNKPHGSLWQKFQVTTAVQKKFAQIRMTEFIRQYNLKCRIFNSFSAHQDPGLDSSIVRTHFRFWFLCWALQVKLLLANLIWLGFSAEVLLAGNVACAKMKFTVGKSFASYFFLTLWKTFFESNFIYIYLWTS